MGTIGRGAALATAGTALSRVTGLMRLAAATYALGVTESALASTYNLANTTPTMIHELIIGGILSSVLLRAYVEVKSETGQEEAWQFIRRVTNATLLLLGAISVLVVLAAPLIFNLYTLRASADIRDAQQMVGTVLLQLFVPQILFYGLSYISTAVLNAHRRFGVPMFAPVLNNLAVIGTFIWFAQTVPASLRNDEMVPTSGVLILGIGTTAGVAFQAIWPFLRMRTVGFNFQRGAGLRDPRFGRLLRMSVFMAGYVATNMVRLWVALFLANGVQGGVAAYQYAFVFFQLPHGLLAVSIVTATFPSLTERAVGYDMDGFARELGRALRGLAYFVLPAIAGYLAIAPQLTGLLLRHGITTQASSDLVAAILRAWAPGIFFFATFYALLRGFYALGNTRTPMLINLVGFVVNVSLNVLAFVIFDDPTLQLAGLAAGHATSYAVTSVVAYRVLTKTVGFSPAAGYGTALTKMLALSVATGVVAWAAATFTGTQVDSSTTLGLLWQILAATSAGILLYAGLSKALRLEEIGWIVAIAKRRR